MGSIALSYTSACVASGPNTPSNVYVLDVNGACAAPEVCADAGPLAGSGVATTISRRDGFAVTATAAFEARSAAFRGLRVESVRRATGSSGGRWVSLGRSLVDVSRCRAWEDGIRRTARRPSRTHLHRTTTLTFASSAGRRGAALAGRLIAPAASAPMRAGACGSPDGRCARLGPVESRVEFSQRPADWQSEAGTRVVASSLSADLVPDALHIAESAGDEAGRVVRARGAPFGPSGFADARRDRRPPWRLSAGSGRVRADRTAPPPFESSPSSSRRPPPAPPMGSRRRPGRLSAPRSTRSTTRHPATA